MESNVLSTAGQLISTEQLLEHWQGHRRLTRKVIEAFPEEAFFAHTLGGMRPFAEMVMELLGVTEGLREIVTGERVELKEHFDHGDSKMKILEGWDLATENINTLWPRLKPERFKETVTLFGQYEFPVLWHIFYFVDNEIHHRGQGYVYLRSLGVEPPFFWER
ncbi:MAG: DinB family protein [Bacteroidota bacterium]